LAISDPTFFAPCPRGLAPALAGELDELGARGTKAVEAGVHFSAPFELAYAANLHSRIASRILWRVAQFPYRTEDDVYAGAKAVRWREHFAAERTFKVETNAHRSPVKSLDFITLRVKDAIADGFREAIGRRPSVSARAPDVRVHAFLDATTCTLYLDTSGEPLFKRGRRDHVGEAPL
jgi:putative N6-adenine-specific DNA methylase